MKIRFIELFKNIKKNIINFISIVVFIFLGVTLFQGLDFSAKGIKYSINETFKVTNSYHIKATFQTLLDDNQVNKLKQISGIDDVEPFFSVNDDFVYNDKTYSSSIASITNNIAKCKVVEGRLPASDDEIVIFQGCSKEIGLTVGDTITFSRNNLLSFFLTQCKSSNDFIPNEINDLNFKNETFTISGVVMQPDYLNHDVSSHSVDSSTGISTNATFFVNESAFNPAIKANYYNGVYLRSSNLDKYTYFDKAYESEVKNLKTRTSNFIKNNIELTPFYSLIETNNELYKDIKEFLYLNNYINDTLYNNDVLLKSLIHESINTLIPVGKLFSLKTCKEHVGVLMGDILHDMLSNEKYALGGVFFIIAFLICYSVINRLVNNEIKLIGTKKALGFDKKAITLTYLGFTLFAVLIGLLLGNLTSLLVESVIVPVIFKQSFSVVCYTKYFGFLLAGIMAVISLVFTSLITIFSCNSIIKKKAITLLQGDVKNMDKKESFVDEEGITYCVSECPEKYHFHMSDFL